MAPGLAGRSRRKQECCHDGPLPSCDRDAGGDTLYVTVPVTWLNSPSTTRSERCQSLVQPVVSPGLQGLCPPLAPGLAESAQDVAHALRALLADAVACSRPVGLADAADDLPVDAVACSRPVDEDPGPHAVGLLADADHDLLCHLADHDLLHPDDDDHRPGGRPLHEEQMWAARHSPAAPRHLRGACWEEYLPGRSIL